MTRLNHWKRFGWLYPVMLTAALWPIVLQRSQRIEPLEISTILTLADWLDEEAAKNLGDPILEEFEALEAMLPEIGDFTSDPRVSRILTSGVQGSSSPALQPDFDAVQTAYGDYFNQWDELARKGVHLVSFAELYQSDLLREFAARPETFDHRNYSSPAVHWPNTFIQYRLARTRKGFAERAIATGQWEEALDNLRILGRSSRPIEVSGFTWAVSLRRSAYGAYRALLDASPPPEVERAALEDLIAMRESDPQWNHWVAMFHPMEYDFGFIPNDREHVRLYNYDQRNRMSSALGWVVRHDAEDAEHRRGPWAGRTATLFASDHLTRDLTPTEISFRLFTPGRWRWTVTAALQKYVRNEAGPRALEDSFPRLPPEMRGELDPWTLAIMTSVRSYRSAQADQTRARIVRTEGRLVEAALAARRFQRETGRWPSSIEELIPDYLAPFEAAPASSSPSSLPRSDAELLYLPLRIGWVKMNESLKHTLWTRRFRQISQRRWGTEWKSGLIDEVTWNRDHLDQPISVLAWEQAFRDHPKLATEVEVAMLESDPGADTPEWKPVDPLYARRVTDESDVLDFRSAYQDRIRITHREWLEDHAEVLVPLPRDMRNSERMELTERTVAPPYRLRIRARLRAPEKILVIWSPGPDGLDQRGAMVYKRIRGAASQGDLVIFPEGF